MSAYFVFVDLSDSLNTRRVSELLPQSYAAAQVAAGRWEVLYMASDKEKAQDFLKQQTLTPKS